MSQGKTVITLGGQTWTFDLPQTISYSTEYGWETMELGTAGLLAQSFDKMPEDPNGFQKVMGSINQEDASAAAMRAFMQTNAFNLGALAQKKGQKAPNPKEAVMFKGVSFRSYSLEFLIAGDSSADVKEKIVAVNEMQRAAAPELTDKQYFFTYPDTGTLTIKDAGTQIIKRRDVAVTNIESNLTPNGYFATWSKGGPVTFTLTVGFTELHLPTKDRDGNILGV